MRSRSSPTRPARWSLRSSRPASDPFVQRLSFIRVFSGTLKKDSTVPATGARKGVKLGPLFGGPGVGDFADG